MARLHAENSGFTTFLGVPIAATNLASAVEELLAGCRHHPCSYRFINAYSLAVASKDEAYRRTLMRSGVNLPDGRPLPIVLDHLNGHGRHAQVRGPSFFSATLDRGRESGIRHFLLGGSPEVLGLLPARIEALYPGTIIVGAHSPPYRQLTRQERDDQDRVIANARPDVVWVGLGTPKQDFEAARVTEELGITTAAVGAAFDFLAGTILESPAWLSRLGLEWAFRLALEPRRLWRRYVFGNARFLWLVWVETRRRDACESQ